MPNELHGRLENSDRIPLFEWIAKNVGVRRARGRFVLVTNADIVFNRELIEFLNNGKLSPRYLYRIDRYDVGAIVPLEVPFDQRLRFCAENAIRVRTAFGTFPVRPALRRNLQMYRGYLKKLNPWEAARWFKLKFLLKVHTGAPGDFTLMAREAWHNLRGHPEMPSQRHIDSYLCAMAMSAGLSQVVLKSPLRIYHQDHDSSEMAARPATDYDVFWRDTVKMLKSRRPIIPNDENWGLGNEQLPESTVGSMSR